eukprot:973112-Pleurochrysis_carterae.AAC.4
MLQKVHNCNDGPRPHRRPPTVPCCGCLQHREDAPRHCRIGEGVAVPISREEEAHLRAAGREREDDGLPASAAPFTARAHRPESRGDEHARAEPHLRRRRRRRERVDFSERAGLGHEVGVGVVVVVVVLNVAVHRAREVDGQHDRGEDQEEEHNVDRVVAPRDGAERVRGVHERVNQVRRHVANQRHHRVAVAHQPAFVLWRVTRLLREEVVVCGRLERARLCTRRRRRCEGDCARPVRWVAEHRMCTLCAECVNSVCGARIEWGRTRACRVFVGVEGTQTGPKRKTATYCNRSTGKSVARWNDRMRRKVSVM